MAEPRGPSTSLRTGLSVWGKMALAWGLLVLLAFFVSVPVLALRFREQNRAALTVEKPGRLRYGVRRDSAVGSTRILFDNGTYEAIRVEIVPAAEDVRPGAPPPEFRVAPGAHAVLALKSLPHHFRVLAEDGRVIDDESHDLDAGLYVYNAGGLWDYRINRRDYATFTMFGDTPGPVDVAGIVFARLGDVDFVFEPLPDSVMIQTYNGISIGTASRRQLVHQTDQPVEARSYRRVAGAGSDLRVVTTGSQAFVVQRADDLNPPVCGIQVHNTLSEPISAELDGVNLGMIQPGSVAYFHVAAGTHTVAAGPGHRRTVVVADGKLEVVKVGDGE